MNCWHCNTELIWGSDHDLEGESDEYCFLSILSCPKCESMVEVYFPIQKENEDDYAMVVVL